MVCNAILFSWMIVAPEASAATPALSLSGASGAPGARVTFSVSLNSSGALPASIEWDMLYSTSDLSSVTGTYYATGAAGKSATCNGISAGDIRWIVSGINTVAIGNGVLATVTFQ